MILACLASLWFMLKHSQNVVRNGSCIFQFLKLACFASVSELTFFLRDILLCLCITHCCSPLLTLVVQIFSLGCIFFFILFFRVFCLFLFFLLLSCWSCLWFSLLLWPLLCSWPLPLVFLVSSLLPLHFLSFLAILLCPLSCSLPVYPPCRKRHWVSWRWT